MSFTRIRHFMNNRFGGEKMKDFERVTENITLIPKTKKTLDKILEYARLMGGSECYGYLLSPANINDGIVYNAILAPGQSVSGISARISGESAAAAKAEIQNLGYKSIGFWHSRGYGWPHHSGTDSGKLDSLLLSCAGNTAEMV